MVLKMEASGICKLLNSYRQADLTGQYWPPPGLPHSRRLFAQRRPLNMNLHKVAVEVYCSL
jgi:hypothetical protein